MQIAVQADDQQWAELTANDNNTVFKRIDSFENDPAVAAFILLLQEPAFPLAETTKPVFINAVIKTLDLLPAGKNVLRINGWTGFLQRNIWDVAGNVTDEVKQIAAAAGRQLIEVKDAPGLVAARSVAMIINEAYLALEEGVSTKEEIDIAMKLGTNYPYGPFEWSERIGPAKIYTLLTELSKSDRRYMPASFLKKEATA